MVASLWYWKRGNKETNLSFTEYVDNLTWLGSFSPFTMLSDEYGYDIIVEYVYKYEDLQESWMDICRKINIPCSNLPLSKHEYRSSKDYRKLYDDESYYQVTEIYDDIIEKFAYTF